MSKEQRGNREAKKPKKQSAKVIAAAPSRSVETMIKSDASTRPGARKS